MNMEDRKIETKGVVSVDEFEKGTYELDGIDKAYLCTLAGEGKISFLDYNKAINVILNKNL